MPVRDRDCHFAREQRHLDASVIDPGELDMPPAGEALQLRVMSLKTVGDPFQPGPRRRAEPAVASFPHQPPLIGL
jgi:hypothetical protein